MPIIKILPHDQLCPNGAEIDAVKGVSICDNLLKNHVDIEHACEKVAACTTCHVAWGLTALSRLSCQAIVADQDLTIELPKYTKNHASEGSH